MENAFELLMLIISIVLMNISDKTNNESLGCWAFMLMVLSLIQIWENQQNKVNNYD